MAEPLKNIFSPKLLEPFAAKVKAVSEAFPQTQFLQSVFSPAYEGMELKQRTHHIANCLNEHLPANFAEALAILNRVIQNYVEEQGEKLSFDYIFLPDFLEKHGVKNPDLTIPALAMFTKWSTCEYAVRPYLIQYPERMYAQMLAWSQDESIMVRRLSSEGIRPRLPWGMGLPALKKDPSPILPILENLKADPAETVRRSVANNLNDISKDHPDLVLDLAARWLGQSEDTDWVVRHACRGLLKKGDARALSFFGFQKGETEVSLHDFTCDPQVTIGQYFHFAFSIHSEASMDQDLRIEYGIDYLTGSGKTSSKVFKIKEITLAGDEHTQIQRRQAFTDFTTRKHYPGKHVLRILVNGEELGQQVFEVISAS
jgi:3-methyladenine DNA glycosylase AlkC